MEKKNKIHEHTAETHPPGRADPANIPEDRRRFLDDLFDVLDTVAEGTYVFLCDMKHDCCRWSESAAEIFGLPSGYVSNMRPVWEEHVHPDDREAYHESIEAIFSGSRTDHDVQYRVRNAGGEYVVCTCHGSVLRDDRGKPDYFAGSIRNHGIREQIDGITGLRNQYGFFEDIQTILNQKKKVFICMIGISRFSELNDVYGYQFGNRLLQKVGRYLLEHVGSRGKAYRLDGTKFALVTDSGTEDSLKADYEDLRAVFRDGFTLEDHYIILETNAGLLELDSFEVNVRTVYACLSYAYGQSRNLRQGDMEVFRNYLNEENKEYIEKIQAIRASIPLNFKGYFLTYQPVVDAHTERIFGAEALLRWESDEYGLVPPADFIGVIERDSLFKNLGQWILRKAVTDMKQVLEEDPDFVICVNLSYTQVGRPGFVDSVDCILKETGFPAGNLCLEITERCRLLDMELLVDVTTALRARGIRIALDDFGTGFSSVNLVRELPLDVIKIDRSFLTDIETNKASGEMVRSLANVASIYGTSVCVEGIESPGMRQKLLRYPVDRLQGYYYSRPLRMEQFLAWARQHR